MKSTNDLTTGNIKKTLVLFALPYLLSCFMQTFYGMADLIIVGIYNGSETTTAVSIGSQVIHMLTVVIAGLAMGATVTIGHDIGQKNEMGVKKTITTTVVLFTTIAIVMTAVLLLLTKQITTVMMTPDEAVGETIEYLSICFAGIPFIMAYNVISSMFRGFGDSKHPMYFVGIACLVNVILDFLFIGTFGMGAVGAAIATVCGQAVSVFISLIMMRRMKLGVHISRTQLHMEHKSIRSILKVGIPIAMQDGLIQVAFIIITVIANSRGLVVAASVGIVEKIISFLFLVPSAFLSAISVITAQNIGAKHSERATHALRFGLMVTVSWGLICCLISQVFPHMLLSLFTKESEVIQVGCEYLRSYSFDCIFAAVHFCFSGYFCGCQKSQISFIHNIISITLVRVPGAYFASKLFPNSLFPMGFAAPIGSFLSAVICILFFWHGKKTSEKG